MDEMENKQQPPEEQEQETDVEENVLQEKDVYIPRPAWQVWGARIALVLFILMLIMYYVNLLRGGF